MLSIMGRGCSRPTAVGRSSGPAFAEILGSLNTVAVSGGSMMKGAGELLLSQECLCQGHKIFYFLFQMLI